ncbi:hypothetical protein Ga0074812_13679, partial [Parafrankia irregularis]
MVIGSKGAALGRQDVKDEVIYLRAA